MDYKATLQMKGEPPKAPNGSGWKQVGSADADKYGAPDKVFHNWQRNR